MSFYSLKIFFFFVLFFKMISPMGTELLTYGVGWGCQKLNGSPSPPF